MRKKIACYGSCITRDNFNSKLNHRYKDRYECVATSMHSSLISIVSPKVKYNLKKLDFTDDIFSQNNLKIAIADLERSFLNELIITQPDYLIMDFFTDIYFGVVFAQDNIMTNNHWYLRKTSFYQELQNKFILKIEHNPSEFLSVWAPALETFINFMNRNLPNCEVIINKGRFSNQLLDNDLIEYLPSMDYYNDIWDKIDNFVISKYNFKYIELDHANYYLTKNHTLGWKIFNLHYHDNYYHDFYTEFNNLIG
ncbi:DUF6270 domain-containing protein [Niallia taxi]|uniref:DUF6270 domain-containing protein n=1 Tax=Niallia taxi TaxID=2499688 RepID=UPI003D2E151F